MNDNYNVLSTELENTKIEYNLLLESIEKERSASSKEVDNIKKLEETIKQKK